MVPEHFEATQYSWLMLVTSVQTYVTTYSRMVGFFSLHPLKINGQRCVVPKNHNVILVCYLLALVGTNQLEFKSKSILGKLGDVQSQGMPGNGTLRQMIQKWIVGCNWGMSHCRGRLTKGRPPRNEHRIHATSASTVLHLAQVASNYSQSDKCGFNMRILVTKHCVLYSQ